MTDVVNISAMNVALGEPVTYSLVIDGSLFSDELTQGGRVQKNIARKEGLQHFVVLNKATQQKVVDTMLQMPSNKVNVTILKLSTDAAASPVLQLGGDETGADEKLWTFYFTDALLPDSISITMYRVRLDDNRIDTLGSFGKLYKNKVNVFKKIDYTVRFDVAQYYFDIRDGKTGTLLPGSAFDPSMGGGGMIGYYGLEHSHLINDIQVFPLGDDNFFYYSTTIMSY